MNVIICSSACWAVGEARSRSRPSPSPSKMVTSIVPPAWRYWLMNSLKSGRGCRLVKLFKRTFSSAVIHHSMRIPRLAFHCAMPHIHRQYARHQGRGNSRMDWKTLLAYITGSVDQALLLRNEYLVTENRLLRNQLTGRVRLTDGERKTL